MCVESFSVSQYTAQAKHRAFHTISFAMHCVALVLTCDMVRNLLGLEVPRDAHIAQLGQLPAPRQQNVQALQVPVHNLQ